MSVRHLDALLHPASVAVIGASSRPGSLGAVVLRNLRGGGFGGPLWAVNPHASGIEGIPCVPDVASLPEAPGLAVICTPAPSVPGLVAELGAKGCRAAVVLSAGLKAPASDGGPSLEQAMLDAARPYLLRVLGPNCIGLLVPGIGLNASFAPANALPGQLAFVTQSGALATAMLDWARGRGIGFSHFISLGDSADVDFGDVLDYLASDSGTRAILLYVESVKLGRKFMSAARAASRNKPVIVVKSGRAPEGARAAASHTGALAGSDAVFDAAARRAGMLRVDTLEALFDAAETLARVRPLQGERLVVVTNGGGAGVLAADALSLAGGKLATLEPDTLAALSACLPATWSRGNPVDIIGDAPVQRYQDALRVLVAAPEVDGILFIHAPTAMVPAPDIAQACLPLLAQVRKPVLGCWLGGPAVAAAQAAWTGAGVPCYDTPERAAAAWMQRATHARNQLALSQVPPAALPGFQPARAQALSLVHEAVVEGREWLDEVAAKALLAAYGIPTVDTRRAHDADEAARLATRIGFPVALKVISPQIVHKSDVGGVALNLNSADEVRSEALRMRQRLARHSPDAVVQGYAVEAMAQRHGARELIAGLATDPVFGPVVLFGRGGIDVELSAQHAVALTPLNPLLARDLVERSGAGPLLAPSRGRPGVDLAAVADTLQKLSLLACDLDEVLELDINPLLADPSGVLALDARVRLSTGLRGRRAAPAIRPYPEDLEEMLVAAGAQFRVRPIRPDDAWRLGEFYAGATPADMRLRFFLSRREVPHSELARYSQIDYDRDMTFIAVEAGEDEAGARMAGEVRAVCDPDNETAEFAIQVATPWQNRGLGLALLTKMLGYLRSRGVQRVIGECLPENRLMLALAQRLGMTVRAGEEVMHLHLELAAPGP
ncbi:MULTISPECIES: bifunctional acetate--CoA ligase family protein/GNAT family N-acetyltransferase [Ramlibacter]|uniref:Bifunctional acetate--CoA ligase family protein/GNAT family N-acetyltransferase n=1 Tax=Ramlibacter aquaticus TaxID=2780094 RepID=A0ABR9SAK7_9BURK|nr:MULTISPECIES: bifunctional acetate--CoA ligase family protein/GNAT family N-acetyltransferase [Ramlibacter]MBE7939384.1 bifunctional acetate--CoA ligase family protein/GNAT family N-acetyltransferase [Ramlibacter aquaticus]